MAENVSLETYKNLELTGNLTAKDPEDGKLTFTLVQAPKRGEVTIGGRTAPSPTPPRRTRWGRTPSASPPQTRPGRCPMRPQ